MKEIIKYLRNLNSYSQAQVANKIGISRQSYIKYESGLVIPSDEIINKLSMLYGVSVSFIKENRIPQINTLNQQYKINMNSNCVSEPEVYYKKNAGYKTYDAWFDGNTVRIANDDIVLEKGQRFKIVIDDSKEEIQKRKDKAWEEINKIISNRENEIIFDDDDPYYKKAILKAKEEKYGVNDRY